MVNIICDVCGETIGNLKETTITVHQHDRDESVYHLCNKHRHDIMKWLTRDESAIRNNLRSPKVASYVKQLVDILYTGKSIVGKKYFIDIIILNLSDSQYFNNMSNAYEQIGQKYRVSSSSVEAGIKAVISSIFDHVYKTTPVVIDNSVYTSILCDHYNYIMNISDGSLSNKTYVNYITDLIRDKYEEEK